MTMDSYYTCLEVSPGLFQIWEPAGVGCSLITGSRRALLIDTGYGFADLRSYVNTLTDLPLTLINTHGHLDHAGGNYLFPQTAFLHPYERLVYDLYQEDKVTHVPYVEKKFRLGKISNPFPPDFDRDSYMEYKAVAFQDAADRLLFDLGERTVEVLYLPGHTRGSLALFDHLTGTLITGDNVGPSLWIMFDQSASLQEFSKRLAMIRDSFSIRQVLASHSPVPYPPRIIDYVLHAVSVCRPETSTIFVHPRHGYKALHHKEPVTDIPGLKTIHVVYPLKQKPQQSMK